MHACMNTYIDEWGYKRKELMMSNTFYILILKKITILTLAGLTLQDLSYFSGFISYHSTLRSKLGTH